MNMRVSFLAAVGSLFLSLAALMTGCALPKVTPGTYGALLPGASGPDRAVQLTLAADQRATLVNDYLNGQPPIIATGTWEPRSGGKVVVTLASRPDRPKELIFTLKEEVLTLVTTDQSTWGSKTVRLVPQLELSGRTWQLDRLELSGGMAVIPDKPARYSMELRPDGTVKVVADCNQGLGIYTLAGQDLVLQRIGYTRKMCPPGSLFGQFTVALESATGCRQQDSALDLFLRDGGTLRFRPAAK